MWVRGFNGCLIVSVRTVCCTRDTASSLSGFGEGRPGFRDLNPGFGDWLGTAPTQ